MEPLTELLVMTCGVLAICCGMFGVVVMNLLEDRRVARRLLGQAYEKLAEITTSAERDLCDCHTKTGA